MEDSFKCKVPTKLELKQEFNTDIVKTEFIDTDIGSIKEEEIKLEEVESNTSPTKCIQAEHIAFEWTPHGFKCPKCPFLTKIEGFLFNHLEKRHRDFHLRRDKMFKCAHCLFETPYKAHFGKHVLRKHTAQTFICGYCQFKTQSPKILEKHICNEHRDKIDPKLKCHICAYVGKSQYLLKIHINKHMNSLQWFKCEHCKFRTKAKRLFLDHTQTKHRDIDFVNCLKCEQCDYKTSKAPLLRAHTKNEHAVEYECKECDFKSKFKSGLHRHIYYRHREFSKVEYIECEMCPYKSKTETFLKVHMINEHGNIEKFKVEKY